MADIEKDPREETLKENVLTQSKAPEGSKEKPGSESAGKKEDAKKDKALPTKDAGLKDPETKDAVTKDPADDESKETKKQDNADEAADADSQAGGVKARARRAREHKAVSDTVKTGEKPDETKSSVKQGPAKDKGDVILEMTDICKDYPMGDDEVLHALKNVSLTVSRGEFLAILGPSGSGKSTLMNIIGCLDVPSSGDYWLDGRHIADEDEASLARIRSREIGFIFQSFYLLQRQTVFENVELPLIYANVPEKERKKRVEEVLGRVGLTDKIASMPNQLSGGQQQRVAIARAVANHPTILLADEPTGALDQHTGAQVMELFHQLNEEGNTIIMITHDPKIASHAKRIVRILDGVISEGAIEDA